MSDEMDLEATGVNKEIGKCIVADYMQEKTLKVSKDTKIGEAVKMMVDKKTNGVVVVDDDVKIVGILSSWDIIKHIVPSYLGGDISLANFEASDVFSERTKSISQESVEDFMTREVHTVNEKTTLIEAAALLANFRFRQLPVVDDDGVLLGVITRTHIKQAVGDVLKRIEQ